MHADVARLDLRLRRRSTLGYSGSMDDDIDRHHPHGAHPDRDVDAGSFTLWPSCADPCR